MNTNLAKILEFKKGAIAKAKVYQIVFVIKKVYTHICKRNIGKVKSYEGY